MRSVRVLLAEDNEDHLFLITRALRDVAGARVEVEAVRDGEETLQYVNRAGRFEGKERPHLILLDLKMPKVGGLEVIERLKSDPQLRSIPIIVLTSSDRQEDVDRAYKLGGNSYVVKPVTLKGLRAGLNGISNYWSEIALLPQPPA